MNATHTPIVRSTVDASKLAQCHRELDRLRTVNANLLAALVKLKGCTHKA